MRRINKKTLLVFFITNKFFYKQKKKKFKLDKPFQGFNGYYRY
jgi:hypothetical protein